MNSILSLKLIGISILFLMLAACGEGTGIDTDTVTSNNAPVALDQSIKTNNDIPVDIALSGTDEDGDSLTYAIAANPQAGTLSGTAPNLTYTPDANFEGDDSFSFTVNDGALTSTSATVMISVAFIATDTITSNNAPVALDQSIKTNNDIPVDIALSGTDEDGDSLTYAIAANPQAGTLSGTAPNLTYTPDANFVGDDSFSFTVNDGALTSTAATVMISVAFIADSTPDAFAFVSQSGVLPGIVVASNSISISGINQPAKIVITNGEYSIDGADYTAAEGLINHQQSIRVRLTTSSVASGTVETHITIGGVNSIFKVTTSGDITDPTAHIIFPTPRVLTTADSIRVRGSTTDEGTIATVSVNGIAAASSDKFLNWTAVVPLEPGMNQITVLVTDRAGNSNQDAPASVSIESRPLFSDKREITYNNASAKLMFYDTELDGLYAFDASSQDYQVISDQSKPEEGSNLFYSGVSFDIDEASNSAYTIDASAGVDRVMQVNLNTGLRTVVTEDTQAFAAHTLINPRLIEIDSDAKVAYVLDARIFGGVRKAIIKFDLSTGAASLVADDSSTRLGFSRTHNMVLDKANNRLLLTDPGGINNLIAVNLATGARTRLLDFSVDLGLSGIKGIAIDSVNQRALIYDNGSSNKRIVAVDLASRAVSPIVEGLSLEVPGFDTMDMVYDGNNDQDRVFIVADGVIHQINLETGVESIFSSDTIPDGINPLNTATGLTIDPAKNRLLVTTGDASQIIAINLLANGERSIVSNNLTIPNGDNPLGTPMDIAISGDQAYVVDAGNLSIIRVDLTDGGNGARSILSDNNKIDENNTFDQLTEIVVDTANARTLVLDSGRQSLLSVDNSSGERAIISDNNTDNVNPIINPAGLIIHGDRGFITDRQNRLILSVDLESGARTVFSGPGQPNASNPFISPTKMVLDAAHSRLLVLDNRRVIAVSIADGARSVLSSRSIPADNLGFEWLTDITLDIKNNQAFILDSTLQRIIAVDLESGERTYYAGGAPNGFPALYEPRSIAFDREANKAVVGADHFYSESTASLKKIDLATGAREEMSSTDVDAKDLLFAEKKLYMLTSQRLSELNTATGAEMIISSNDTHDGDRLVSSQALALDIANGRAYVTDSTQRLILSIDLTTGERAIVSSNSFPDASAPLFTRDISSLVFDSDNQRLLVLDPGVGIIAVDLSDGNVGARIPFSTREFPNNENGLRNPSAMILDEAGKRLLVIARTVGSEKREGPEAVEAVFAINLATGERAILHQDSEVTNFLISTQNVKDISLISPDLALITDLEKGVVLMDLLTGEQAILAR